MLSLCLLLAGVVTLEIEGEPDLSPEDVFILEKQLSDAIDAHALARKVEGEVIRWSIDVGATRIQILAERLAKDGQLVARDARVGSREVGRWGDTARELIEALYGESAPVPDTPDPSPVVERSPPLARKPSGWVPAVFIGAGATALAGSIAFGASSVGASSALGDGLVIEPRLGELTTRSTVHGALAVGMAVGAVACAVIGILLLRD